MHATIPSTTRRHASPEPSAPTQLIADDPPDTGATLRWAAAGVTALSVAMVAVGAAAGVTTVQALGASIFFLFGIGSAATSVLRRVSGPNYCLFSVTTSLTITLLSGFAIAEAHFWHPLGVFVVLAGAAAVLHGTALVRTRGLATDRRWSFAEVRQRVRSAAPALVASVVGLVLVIGSCLAHHGSYAGFAGMFSRIGPWWYAGIVLLVVGVVAAGAAGARWVAGFCVVVFVTALALTPALLYDYPTVTSAARHVGVAQVIRQIGGVDPAQGIYHRWPALFAGSATIWDVGDVTNPLSWSRWWPVLVNPVAALGVRALAERILVATRIGPVSGYRLWLGAAVFAVANVLGNAYFSPQSTCFVLALVVLVLAVPTTSSATGRGKVLRLTGLTVVALAITVTHQLTPYLILPALFVLIVFRLIRPWYVLLLVGVPAVGWALANLSILGQFINLGALGKATSNAAPPSHGGDLGYRGLTDFAIYSPMTLFLVIGAAATFIALRHRGRLRWALLACAASPAALFAGNNYGNEALFRAALFSLPWLVTLLVSGRWRLRARLPAFGAALLIGAAVFSLGTDGMDWYRVIRPGTVQAVQKFELEAPAKSVVLMTGSGNAIPGRLTARSPRVDYVARDTLHVLPKSVHYNGANDVYSMTRALTRRGNPAAYYALVTTSIGAYDDLYGIQRYHDFLAMRRAMQTSRYWKPEYRSASATLYRLDVPAFRAAAHRAGGR